jgi:hypothetical protein
MIQQLKQMLGNGPVEVSFDKHNDNREGFLYKRGKTSLGPLTVVVFSYIQVATVSYAYARSTAKSVPETFRKCSYGVRSKS